MKSLVVSTSREDAVRTYAVNLGEWPIEGPIKREEADGWVHALDSAPQIFTVLSEVVVSEMSLSVLSGGTRASLTCQQ
jgi:hypothetical protein